MDVIHELAKRKTVILISHRLANVVGSDRIYMMKDGRIEESGSHEKLLEAGGEYAKLYRSQMELEQYGKMEPEQYGKMKPEQFGKIQSEQYGKRKAEEYGKEAAV